MKRGFYTIMAAQFLSSLADNALLIAAIALLRDIHAPEWMTPMLKLFFFVSYVVLAAFVAAFADSMPKGRVMMITNMVKVGGCLLMLFKTHPLIAYAVVGLGAAAYSPAKYGILTELLPPEKLVMANGWIEGLTVGSIILGFVVGGVLVSPVVSAALLSIDFPLINTHVNRPGEAAVAVIALIYFAAAAVNLRIPDTGARYTRHARSAMGLLQGFGRCVGTLWRDKLGQITLAVTTLFWGAGATLQFIILKWCETVLGMSLSQGAMMQAVVAVGIAIGSVAAAARRSDGAAGVRDGADRLLAAARRQRAAGQPDRHLGHRGGLAANGAGRRAGRLLRRADECTAAAPRPCAAVGRALDCRAELQREPQYPDHARRLCRFHRRRLGNRNHHHRLRAVRQRDDGAGHAAPLAQPARVRFRLADRPGQGQALTNSSADRPATSSARQRSAQAFDLSARLRSR
jgi:hypothetical protein